MAGFGPGVTYAVELWQFDDPGQLTREQHTVSADGAGDIVLDLSVLPANVTDVAVKIGDYRRGSVGTP